MSELEKKNKIKLKSQYSILLCLVQKSQWSPSKLCEYLRYVLKTMSCWNPADLLIKQAKTINFVNQLVVSVIFRAKETNI